MNKKQQIKQIESKISEVQNTLTLWTKNIENYHIQLKKLIAQLNELKNDKISKK